MWPKSRTTDHQIDVMHCINDRTFTIHPIANVIGNNVVSVRTDLAHMLTKSKPIDPKHIKATHHKLDSEMAFHRRADSDQLGTCLRYLDVHS